ncbi:ras-related protein Rab-26 isoform X6 [Sminthopsis crassicaudata]|uniref:ras-related protein Rab-26 isoform X6 n=1 Tax=Sminthopsis crassicaudata TaxID=9301 RepID=UPI003D681B48
MSRKKTPKSKAGSTPASSLPTAKENGPVGSGGGGSSPGPGPAPETPRNGLLLSGRPSLSSSGDFYDVAFKVMLVGDSGVGKTCLLVRFKDGAFLAGTFISTVGIDFRAWLTEIHEYAQKDVVLMLLGNKVDSTQERVVKREDGEKLAKVSTSSRHGFGQEWRIGNRSISKVFSESPRWGQQQLWIMSSLVIWSFPRSETQHIHKYQILIAVTYLGPK